MPTYDYRCSACGHEFEMFQQITAKPAKVCPECAGRALQRLIGTGSGVLFKGSGFYQTDYRSESYKQAAKADTSSESSSSSSSKDTSKDKPKDTPKDTSKKSSDGD